MVLPCNLTSVGAPVTLRTGYLAIPLLSACLQGKEMFTYPLEIGGENERQHHGDIVTWYKQRDSWV